MKQSRVVAYKRKHRGLTDYRRRKNLLAGNMPRLVVRKSINNILAQVVNFDGASDKILFSAHSSELKKYDWKFNTGNIPSAYLTGLLVGKKASKHNVKKAILDIGLNRSVRGSSQYALVKGAIDAGLEIPHSEDMIPEVSRIEGKHISDYFKKSESKNQFSLYKEQKLHVEEIAKQLNHVKEKILKS